MQKPIIRKLVVHLEKVRREQGQDIPTLRKVVAAAVIANPFAGRYVENLDPLPEFGEALGHELTPLALRVLGCDPTDVQSYGKAGIAGLSGELEHVAAVLHPRLGKVVRSYLPGAKSIMPSAKKRAAAGTGLDVPLHNVADEWSFDHFDAMSVNVDDAPAPDELLIALALANGGRPLARTKRPS